MIAENMSILDLLDPEEAEALKPIKSTDWKWSFKDYPKEKNGLKVFSCFACGGGSTMGYKLAGCEVIGCVEIDKKMNDVYVANHHPKHNFCMDIREFNKMPDNELPNELFSLDILDGSPPCTTFSMAGEREKNWGKAKKFREGQAEQTLDDLSFVFIETAKKLHPKFVIMENVEGLLLGAAYDYVRRIYKDFDDAGYNCRHYLCKGEYMGVPQTRHRVFFIASRKDISFNYEKLDMSFHYEPITYGIIKSIVGDEWSKLAKQGKLYNLFMSAIPSDKNLGDINLRLNGKASYFQCYILHDNEVLPTIRASRGFDAYRYVDKKKSTVEDVIHAQTFPEDFDFGKKTMNTVSFICGMSVPPIMIKRIVTRIIETGVFEK